MEGVLEAYALGGREAQCFSRVWLMMPYKENNPFIPGSDSLGGLETNLNFLLAGWFLKVLHIVLKNRMQGRENVLFRLWLLFRCKSMDLSLSLVELLVAC